MFVPYNPGVIACLGIAISTGIVAEGFSMTSAMPYFFHGMGLFVVMLIAILTGWGREFAKPGAARTAGSSTGSSV
jgi:Na+/H+ antiporter NhaC